jgi:hypothetical protein
MGSRKAATQWREEYAVNCDIWNVFFDWVWLAIAISVIVWALMSTLKERWSIAANLRAAAGLVLVGAVIVLCAAAFINSGAQSPCRAAEDKVEGIHRVGNTGRSK